MLMHIIKDDDTRDVKQQEALAVLQKSGSTNCTLNITMRVGKTKIIIDYIKWFMSKFDKNVLPNILWIADSANEKNTALPAEFNKFNLPKNLQSKINIIHWRSMHTVVPDDYKLVIFNECQNITDGICGYLHGFNKAKIIGMTGTYPRYQKAALLKELGLNNIVYTYLVDDAAEDNVISDYEIIIKSIPMSIDKDILVEYDGGSFMTSEQLTYNNLSKKIDDSRTAAQEKFMRLNRMRAVSKFKSKCFYAKRLLIEYAESNLKTLVFAIDNEHAKSIGKYIYSSHTDNKNLVDFENGKIPYLILVNKGGTGDTYNMPIDRIIMLAPNSSNRLLQKLGRGLINNKSGKLKIIIPISQGTVQSEWTRKAFSELDQTKIKYV